MMYASLHKQSSSLIMIYRYEPDMKADFHYRLCNLLFFKHTICCMLTNAELHDIVNNNLMFLKMYHCEFGVIYINDKPKLENAQYIKAN